MASWLFNKIDNQQNIANESDIFLNSGSLTLLGFSTIAVNLTAFILGYYYHSLRTGIWITHSLNLDNF